MFLCLMLQDQCIIIQGDSEGNISSLGSDSIDHRDTSSSYEYVLNSELLPTPNITSAQSPPADFETIFIYSLQITGFGSSDRKKRTESISVVQIATQDSCGFLQIPSKHFNVSKSTCTTTFASHILPNSSLISLFYLMPYIKFI